MPYQRPSANELLQHRFIKSARKTSYLTELIERYTDYRARSPKGQQMYQPTVRNSMAWNGSMRSEWDFNTVRTTSAMGSLRSMAKDIMPPGMVLDEEYEDEHGDDESMFDTGTINTTAATTKGIGQAPNGSTPVSRTPWRASGQRPVPRWRNVPYGRGVSTAS